jgi:rhodanese-related sulfurtransferase
MNCGITPVNNREVIIIMLARRKFLAISAFGFGATIASASFRSAFAEGVLSAAEAYRRAAAGSITLIDIRQPDEWAETGSGVSAKRLDMRRDDFETVLGSLVGGNRDAPIALICARGVRSSRLSRRLREAGFTNIIDVPEGMLGSYAGKGWIARELPLNKN